MKTPMPATPTVNGSMPTALEERLTRFKKELHHRLIGSMDLSRLGSMSDDELRVQVRAAVAELCQLSPDLLSIGERERLANEVLDETFGHGPLEPLLKDGTISDILINGPKSVYIERNGLLEPSKVVFNDDNHLLRLVQRIVGRVGRRIDETTPMVDARLADGSRINAIIPPLALDGPLVSIRRFGTRPFLIKDLIACNAITADMAQFLTSCVKARTNILISGGTGSGKTTFLNALSAAIPAKERVATIEDAAELRLQQPHVVRMETRVANVEGEGMVNTRDLVRNVLRMRPDRIIIGECRGPEVLDMLQAMNTGHEGSMTTVHANETRDALSRLEMMVGMAGFEMPIWTIRRQIVSALQIVVQTARLMGGARKIVRISEITGMEGDVISMQHLFAFKQTGVDENGAATGYFYACGIRPKCLERLESYGIHLSPEMFERRNLPHAAGLRELD